MCLTNNHDQWLHSGLEITTMLPRLTRPTYTGHVKWNLNYKTWYEPNFTIWLVSTPALPSKTFGNIDRTFEMHPCSSSANNQTYAYFMNYTIAKYSMYFTFPHERKQLLRTKWSRQNIEIRLLFLILQCPDIAYVIVRQ
jgi:hypothetical protein